MILITGATGNVGRPLVESLTLQGAKVRAVTRNPDPGLPAGVEIDSSLDGVTSVFLNPRAVGDAAADLVARARAHGVRRVVALSAINVDDPLDAQPSRYRGDLNKEVEAAAIDSGLEWVSLRPTMFCSNAVGTWAGQIRAGDVVYGPYPAASWAPIDEWDVADVAAHALLHDDLVGRKVALTGPRSLTQQEMVQTIGEVLGRNLSYHEVPPELASRRFAEIGLPAGFGHALLALLAKTAGTPEPSTGEVAAILGRPARTFAEWATDNKEAFLS
ncbi:SDR family oxidoreductase [Amycolatopsis sp. GM8]|uniref:SDR family oxidoreductase n=1 Tax=Amycolatopsis sp. GM8 TaxID=2896530 RepID=UPI001F48A23E|nr:NAD(P)H-binding protein [Amycolatopsis sp. GM8]